LNVNSTADLLVTFGVAQTSSKYYACKAYEARTFVLMPTTESSVGFGEKVTPSASSHCWKLLQPDTDTTYSNATTSADGLMSSTDKTKLNGIDTGAEVNVLEGVQVNGTDLTIDSNKKVNIPLATTSTAGLMSSTDKTSLGYMGASLTTTGSTGGNTIDVISNDTQTGPFTLIKASAVGAVSGICPLNASAKIDSQYLPSFVDDVIEAYVRSGQTELSSTWLATGSATGTVITPETGKIYVLMNSSTNYDVNTQFRWGGSAYVKLNDGGVTAITNTEIDTICV